MNNENMMNAKVLNMVIVMLLFLLGCNPNEKGESTSNYIYTQKEFEDYHNRQKPLREEWDSENPNPSHELLSEELAKTLCECIGYVDFDLIDKVSDEELRTVSLEVIEKKDDSYIEKYSMTALLAEGCNMHLEGKALTQYGYNIAVLKPKIEAAVNERCPKLRKKQLKAIKEDFISNRLKPIFTEVRREASKEKE